MNIDKGEIKTMNDGAERIFLSCASSRLTWPTSHTPQLLVTESQTRSADFRSGTWTPHSHSSRRAEQPRNLDTSTAFQMNPKWANILMFYYQILAIWSVHVSGPQISRQTMHSNTDSLKRFHELKTRLAQIRTPKAVIVLISNSLLTGKGNKL